MPAKQWVHWVVTVFDGTDLSAWCEDRKNVVAECEWQLEEGGETHHRHYQAHFRLHKKATFTAAQKFFHPWHCEGSTVGDGFHAAMYCLKGETAVGPPQHWGAYKRQGERSDLVVVRDHFKNGGTIREAVEDDSKVETVARHFRFAQFLQLMYAPKRNLDRDFRIIIYWGPTGTGKSRAVNDLPVAKYRMCSKRWFDGYEGEQVLWLDEFNPHALDLQQFEYYLQMFDRYEFKVEIKGHMCQLQAHTAYLTSNHDPAGWFSGNPNREAFFRRVFEIRRFEVEVADIVLP